jgi:hypothetical protein
MKKSSFFRSTGIKGGKERSYKRPYPIDQEIPTVHELMGNPNHAFIMSFPANAEGLVWITRQKLSLDNYRSFIYAMAVFALTQYNSNWGPEAWQFHHNLRMLRNKINNKHILLSGSEKIAMNYMLNELNNQSKKDRLMFMGAIVKDLERKSVESSSACG